VFENVRRSFDKLRRSSIEERSFEMLRRESEDDRRMARARMIVLKVQESVHNSVEAMDDR
jgi:lipoate synthase